MSSIRTLRIFLAVPRTGSFTAAGKEVGLTAAAVGLQIKALEVELHQPLFDRSARSVILNTAGRERVTPVQELVDRYVIGEHILAESLRRVWRDTTQWLVWDSPVYAQLLSTVRDMNAMGHCDHTVRVLLGDPPIDWSP